MSTPRIPPTPTGKRDETTKASESHRQKIDKVEKISEIDDESRAKKFRTFVEEEEQEAKELLPTPLSIFAPSSKEDKNQEGSASPRKKQDAEPLPNPSFSPPPSALLQNTVPKEEKEETAKEKTCLPRAEAFWENKEPFLEKESKIMQKPQAKSQSESKSPPPKGRKEILPSPLAVSSEITPTPQPSQVSGALGLSADTLAIYAKIVGTISIMVSPMGDSRTELFLDSPAFAHSPFYGASITIERFSSAPYQLNIELTGSNEAVNLFNQNIPNLMTAFQNGKFSYTIQRVSAVHKPLFRRKEKPTNHGSKQGSQ